jgi:GTP:adenosylcobinamide-phosphate guanylyltransferase
MSTTSTAVAASLNPTAADNLSITLDAPAMTSISDSGVSSIDNVTRVTNPVFADTVAELESAQGYTMTLFDGAVSVGSAVLEGGSWAIASETLGDGAHTMSLVLTDPDGNVVATSPTQVIQIITHAVAPSAPVLLASFDSGLSNSDQITNLPTLRFSGTAPAGSAISLYDGTVKVGSGVADGLGNWQAVNVLLGNGQHSLTAVVTDIAGNQSAPSAALQVTVDRERPQVLALKLDSASDTGANTGDGVTSNAAPLVTGTTEAGATVVLSDGQTQIGTAVADAQGNWSIATAPFTDGAHTLTVKITDVAGNTAAQSGALLVTIDTKAPLVTGTPLLATQSDSGLSHADGITSVAAPQLSGSAEAGATVALFDGEQQVGSAVANAQGAWSTTTSTLADGVHNLTVKAIDAAGNVSPASPALVLTIDSLAPDAPSRPDLLAGSDSGSSDSDDITNVTLPVLTGSAEAGARVSLYDGDTLVGSGVADAAGNWQIGVTAALSNGAHSLTAQATDTAGNASAKSPALDITVDTRLPVTPTDLDLNAGSDLGLSNSDNVTSVTAPVVSGKAEAGATVSLFEGDTKLGTAVADASGAWSITSSALADGVHHLTASTSALTGVVSQPSAALVVTIDTAAPAVPGAPVLETQSDSGQSNTDGITNAAAPVLSGTAEAGATVTLFTGALQLASTVADANGVWRISDKSFDNGVYNLTVTATDLAGNVSAASPALALTIDKSAPATPGKPDLLASSDHGVSDTDNITNVVLPTLAGQAEANASVSLYDGATVVGSTVADAAGNWQITVAQPLANGPHNLTVKATDVAGNISAASETLVVTVTNATLTAPGTPVLAPASDSGASSTDKLTNVTTPLITGTAAANATVALYDGDTVVATTTANAAGAWSVSTSALADGVHSLTAGAIDVAGNASPLSAPLVITIDTAAPAAPGVPALDAASDSGRSNTDGITNDTTPTVSGTAEAGATVKLYDGATQVGTAVADTAGVWSITTSALAAGAHSLTVKATDLAGNVSAASPALALTIDTSAPAAPGAPDLLTASDSGVSNVDNLTNVVLPTITGKAEANASVSLFDGTTLIGTGLADASGNWQITVTQALATGVHSLTAQAADAAGNLSVKSTALSITIDTTPLAAPAALDLATASDKGLSATDNITNLATPTIGGTSAASATVNLYDGDTLVGTAVANTSGVWSIASSTLADGVHHLTARTVDSAGNLSAPSTELLVTIDTAAPAAPGVPVLDPLSDSGSSSTDGLTKDTTPTLSGTAEAGATVKVFDGVTQVGTAVANAEGAWSITTSALAAGVHSLTATATDVAGNISAASPALTVTVDISAVAPSALDLVTASDSGISSTDNLTNVVLPTIAGKAEANSSVSLFDGTTLIGITVVDASGNWQITATQPLTDGTHSLTAQATDAAGNLSAKSTALSVTIDTTPLAAPTALDLATASDKGVSTSDNISNVATPTISGNATAGATVNLYDGDTLIKTMTADVDTGVWSVVTGTLADGVHHLTARTVDPAGNLSVPSTELLVTIDTAAPAAPGVPVLSAASDSGNSNADGITNDTTPTLSGTAEAGATVKLYDGTTQVGTAVANAEGIWSITSSALAAGAHSLTVKATDVAGNVSAASPALAITVDTSSTTPSALDLVTASDSGISSTDNLTNVVLPTIAGKAEANASVSLFDGTTLIGTGLADASGNWQITSTQALADGVHSLTAQATDVAGNLSLKSTALSVTIDTTPLAAPAALDLAAASDKGVSTSDNITNLATPTIGGTSAASATVNLYDGDVKVGTAVANTSGVWSIVTSTLADGVHHLTAVTVDPAGNVSAPSAELVVTIDTVAPAAPGVPVLDLLSDSGNSNADGITNDTTPTLSGTAEAGATVKVFDGVTQVGTVVANAEGAWSLTTSALAAGVHSLTVTATDVAGNISAASPALALTVDIAGVAPSALDLVTASDSGISSTDNLTNVVLPTIAGKAEANASVSLFDGTTLIGTGLADASGNWQITSTQALADGVHSLTAQATDVAGNLSLKSTALSVTIDTTPLAAPAALDLAAASDKGVSTSDNITNLATPTIGGTSAASATVNLYDGDVKVGTAVANTSGVWSIVTSTLADGVHHLTAVTVDPAGNVSAPSAELVVTIDTVAPAAPGVPVLDLLSDSGNSNADGITNDTTPTLSGTAEAGATVKVFDGVTQVGTVVANAEGAWSLTTSALAAGVHSLTVTATDVAGNISAASPALALTVDIAGVAPSALDLVTASDSGISSTDNLTNVVLPTIAGKAEANASVSLFDGTTLIGTGLADASGNWQITSTQALADGVHSLTAQATDVAGNLSLKSTALSVTIDTTPLAAPAALDLATASDKGVSTSDNITNLATPTIGGTSAVSATVNLYDGDIKVGTAVANTSGVWSIVTSTLADGVHHLTAVTVDPAGNVSAPSAELVVTIDTVAPTAPATPVLDATSDSGRSNTDGITNDTTPTVIGTAEAGATMALFDGATQVGSAVANAEGAWSITASTLAAGAHSLTVKATDVAGNVSAASPALTITIDTSAPAAPTAVDLLTAFDAGASNSDNISNVVLPTIAGKAEANASVSLFDGTTLIGTALADASGNWQIAVTQPLADGVHSLTAQATDVAGNLSVKSTALSVTIDTAAPLAPAALDLVTASDKGVSNTDNLTNLATPGVTGTAEAGSTVTLYEGDTKLGSVVANSSGVWTIASSKLSDGVHHLSASATDVAGNVSTLSGELVVTIDTVAPATPGAPMLDPLSDTGSSSTDGITNDTTPTLSGTAEAGATVALFDGSTQVGTAVADNAGAWSITSSALAAGAHSLTVKATDAAGNLSAASAALAITIDTTAPALPTLLDLLATSDSGSSSTDNLTNVVLPTLSGKAEANANVSLYDGTTLVGSGVANASGVWQITLSQPLADGVHGLSAQATDAAGNSSAKTAVLNVTIDATAPGSPSGLDLVAASDKGVSSTDNITNLATPAITGNAAAAAVVTVFDNGVKLGTATANASGVWSYTAGTLADGLHHLTASTVDLAGNLSLPSETLDVTIDTKLAVSAANLADASDSNVNTDNVTNVAQPVFTGTADAGATVSVYDGTKLLGTTLAGADGTWSFISTTLADGVHSIITKATDLAGNAATGATLSVTIDTVAPVLTDGNANANFANTGASANSTVGVTVSGAGSGATYALLSNPGNLFAIDSNGVITMPNSALLTPGAHSVTVQATDKAGNASAGVVFTIDTNTAPTISSIANVTTKEDIRSTALSFTVGDSESDPGALTLSGSSAHGTVSFAGSGANRTVVFNPDTDWYGTTSVSVTVRDPGGMTATTSFTTTVTSVDDQSTPQSDVVNGIEHGAASATKATLLSNDTDIDSSPPSSIISLTNISGGTASLSGSNVVFTAGSTAHGLGHYQYTVADGGVGDVWVKLNPVTDSDYSHEIQQMYVGYFNRPADQGGLSGKLALIANMSAPDRKAALDAMGAEFVGSPEYLNTWGGLSDEAVVRAVYHNLFGRDGAGVAQSEIDYWVARLATGADLTRASLVWNMADSAQNSDIATTLNKTLVAQYFTDQMSTVQNANYINGASTVVTNYLDGVTSDNSTVITAAENTASTIVAATGVAKTSGGTVMAAQHIATDTVVVTLQGTSGADQFVLNQQADQLKVLNFSSAEGDHLLLQRALNGLTFTTAADVLAHSHVDGGNTVIDLGEGHAVTLVGVTVLTAADIVLVG